MPMVPANHRCLPASGGFSFAIEHVDTLWQIALFVSLRPSCILLKATTQQIENSAKSIVKSEASTFDVYRLVRVETVLKD